MTTEVWKDIIGYEGLYQISNLGNVLSLSKTILRNGKYPFQSKECLMTHQLSIWGYPHVHLRKDNKRTIKTIHRLVAEAFIDNPYQRPFVNHINGIKTDFSINNLEWVTRIENECHAVSTGLKPHGERIASSKLTSSQVSEIIAKYRKGIVTYFDLAKEYGVSFSLIGQIIRGKIWNTAIGEDVA